TQIRRDVLEGRSPVITNVETRLECLNERICPEAGLARIVRQDKIRNLIRSVAIARCYPRGRHRYGNGVGGADLHVILKLNNQAGCGSVNPRIDTDADRVAILEE